ncbi:MerR family transcriptional regulator [Burkholderia mallei]|nr:MerR family transcriptional regulator [Burkholderia mallei]
MSSSSMRPSTPRGTVDVAQLRRALLDVIGALKRD